MVRRPVTILSKSNCGKAGNSESAPIQAGSRSDEMVSQLDFAATLAAITVCPLSNDQAIDGYNSHAGALESLC